MVTSDSHLSYKDCFEAMDKALEDDKGIRIPFRNEGDAINFRLRCNKARVLDRSANRETYPNDHPLYGQSVYNVLVLRIKHENSLYFLYFEKNSTDGLDVQPLSTIGDEECNLPSTEEPSQP